VFFGESMFSQVTDASKVALVGMVRFLEQRGFALIDCQVASQHLTSLGARAIPRREFLRLLALYCKPPGAPQFWRTAAP
jgi:leucyl/phenylalanyl-tRNA--protein transferase